MFSNTFHFPESSPPPSAGSLICNCQKACTRQVCIWWDNSLNCQHSKGLCFCVFTQIACPSYYTRALSLVYHASSCIFHVADAQMFFVIILSSTGMHLSAAEIRQKGDLPNILFCRHNSSGTWSDLTSHYNSDEERLVKRHTCAISFLNGSFLRGLFCNYWTCQSAPDCHTKVVLSFSTHTP